MTDLSLERSREAAKTLIIAALKENQALDIEALINLLGENHIPSCQRIAKEVAWSMCEDGLAFWNDAWLLELR